MGKSKRELIIDALNHKEGAVPHQIRYTLVYADMISKAQGKPVDLEALFDNYIFFNKYKKNSVVEPGIELDLFGIKWDKRNDDGGDIGVPFDPPIVSAELKPDGSFYDYAMPKPNLEFACSQVRKLEDEGDDKFRMFGITVLMYERAWCLRGMENVLTDFLCEPDFTHYLLDRITDHHLALLDAVLDNDYEAIYLGDDWGSQKALIMGAETWRKFIGPCVRKLVQKAKSKGKYVFLHSCGNNWDIIGDWIDMGIDCYETVQPEVYDLKKLKHEFGKDITFYGAISNQQFLPHASAAEVKAHCLELLKYMAVDGGYILSPTHHITPDIPIENAFAIIEAANEFNQQQGYVL